MCGIVGLYTKNTKLQDQLGSLVASMLFEMTERGPDSAGVAFYDQASRTEGQHKVTVYNPAGGNAWSQIAGDLQSQWGASTQLSERANHAVISTPENPDAFVAWLESNHPSLRVMSVGDTIEIYKDMGLPADFIDRFNLKGMRGSHALGHTRMATESAVTTEHSHPFSTGEDLCLVHNGSLSNHNQLREVLRGEGIRFRTDNDSEVAAGYMAAQIQKGHSLEQALNNALKDLDGFYTFAIGTRTGFAVMRDPIACKPAVLAETDDWVAMSSEYRAISHLPGAAEARIWEPEPGRIYTWEREA